jgi:hypothetical protein
MVDNSNNFDSSGSEETPLEQSQSSLFAPIVDSDGEQAARDTVRRTQSSRPGRAGYGIFPLSNCAFSFTKHLYFVKV